MADLARLEQSALYRLSGKPTPPSSGFGPGSAPYLWASEFPAPVLAAIRARLRPPVLCVAGSGDNAVELLRLKLWPLLAVDVARAACYVNELKAAALELGVSRSEFLRMLPVPPPRLLARLAPRMSREAAAYWRRSGGRGGPEGASLTDRRPHLPGLAYLASEAAYGEATRAALRWPLLNTSLESCLARSAEPFGTLYVSNVAEYVQRNLLLVGREAEVGGALRALYGRVAAALAPGGIALAYVFEPRQRAERGREAGAMAAAGLALRAHAIEFERFGTRFHHCVLEGRRP